MVCPPMVEEEEEEVLTQVLPGKEESEAAGVVTSTGKASLVLSNGEHEEITISSEVKTGGELASSKSWSLASTIGNKSGGEEGG